MGLKRVAAMFVTLFVIGLTGGPQADAQSEFSLQYPHIQAPKAAVRAKRAIPRIVQRKPPPVRYEIVTPRRSAPATVTVADTPMVPRVEASIFITVMGDALAEQLHGGLEDAFSGQPEIAVTRKVRSESSLARLDYYDWPKHANEIVAGTERLSFAVMMVGVNERQAVRDDTGTHEFGSDRWWQIYAQRVEAVARPFVERRIPLFWVGLPPMQGQRFSADMLALNEQLRAQVQRSGATYIDVWEAFVDAQGRFSTFGPDLGGQVTRLRTADGIYLTAAGARKLAYFAEVELRRLIDRTAPATLIALPSDANTLPGELRDGGIERAIDRMVAGLPEPAGIPVLPVKPIAGPIIPLTRVDLAAGGELASRRSARRELDEASLLIEQVYVEGRAPEPKPGRADDFRWPRS